MKGTVLVVDDHARPRRALAAELEEAGFDVVQASDGAEGWQRFCDCNPDVVITDLMMPNVDGQDLLSKIRMKSDAPVFMFSAEGTMKAAVAALKAGADDFVSSVDVDVEDLVQLVIAAMEGRRGAPSQPDLDQRIVGESAVMRRVRSRMIGLAPLGTPVLAIGEVGTGGDAVVHALHEIGSSGEGRLITIDCETYEPRRGVPKCGAVYLDGVERLSIPAQGFWADRLVEYESRRFREAPRVFASSHPLFRLPSQIPFHGYLRGLLMRFPLALPPLRERPEDVPAIADRLVVRLADSIGRQTSLSPSARSYLRGRVWQGNINQLEQLLERAVAFCSNRSIRRELLVELVDDFEESLQTIRKRHGMRERDDLLDALQQTGGNISRTAEKMGRSRGAIYRLIEKHGIQLTSSR
jgi:DNA-binding NtrC family response regulator